MSHGRLLRQSAAHALSPLIANADYVGLLFNLNVLEGRKQLIDHC